MKNRTRKSIICNAKKRNLSKLDPSRTLDLRRAFSNDLKKRWKLLKGRIVKAFNDDLFGLEQVRNEYNPDQPRDSQGRFGHGTNVLTHAAELIKSLPSAIVERIKSGVSKRYEKLEARYGPRYAKAIIGAALVGLPLPMPGASVMAAAPVVALAELHRYVSSRMTRNVWGAMSNQDIQAAARQLVREVYTEFDQEPPPPVVYPIKNVFCPTGEGGGIDPSCSPGTVRAGTHDTEEGESMGMSAYEQYEMREEMGDYTPRTFFHGTTDEALKHIWSEGLIPGKGSGGDTLFGGAFEEFKIGDREVSVYITKKATVAAFYADMVSGKTGTNPVLLRITVPPGIKPELKRDEQDPAGIRYIGKIPPEWIEHVPHLTQNADNVRYAVFFAKPTTTNTPLYDFPTDVDRIRDFRDWLKTQFKEARLTDRQLFERYAQAAFRRGQARAFDDVNVAKRTQLYGHDEKLDFYEGTKEDFLKSSFARPVSVERIGHLAERSFSDMDGVTDEVETRMVRVLSDGLATGKSPREVARDLDDVTDLGRERSLTIARTEIIRAHAEGQLTGLQLLGVEEVGVQVEQAVTHDDKLCELCESMEGITLTVDEARGMIPRHPGCRCAWVPANVGEKREPTSNRLLRNGRWITLGDHSNNPGQHVYIDDDGDFEPSGPTKEQDEHDEWEQREYGKREGREAVPDGHAETGGQVAEETQRPAPTSPDQGGDGTNQPYGTKTDTRVPAHIDRVNAQLDKYEKFFNDKGQHDQAQWMRQLRDHVNTVGVEESLRQLGDTSVSGHGETTQYEGGWDKDAFDSGESGYHLAQFCESYLNRHGIIMSHQPEADAIPNAPIVSSLTPSQGGTVLDRSSTSDFLPKDPVRFKDKLDESKHLPGLERSEDISKLMGKPVTHLTPEVHEKLDQEFGKDKWIVKAYGDEAAAGFGIYFPQRSRQIADDARNAIWSSGSELSRYGFSHTRDESGTINGIRHTDGKEYKFGTKEYDKTIQGDVRHWGDVAAHHAENEKATALPGGGKDFMVQPAFNVVGISEADRAAGVTIKYGQEGRTHFMTRDGKVEAIPHTTWLKGENLPVVFENADTRAMADAARKAIEQLPHSERNGQIYAPDIVKTTEGYKVVEVNPANHTGSSGYLGNNPMIIDSYVSHVAGRTPAHVQFVRKLLTSRKGLAGNVETENRSYFSDCERDTKGRCLPADGGELAPKAEVLASAAIAVAKINNAPTPDKAAVASKRAALEKAKTDPTSRAGGDSRGSSTDRKVRAKKLFAEFEAKDKDGNGKGYCVCPWTGIKMHWADPKDSTNNPHGYPKFEQGKIFTAYQGGSYNMPNLLPESFTANRSRNDKPMRTENLK